MRKLLVIILMSAAILQSDFVMTDCMAVPSFSQLGAKFKGVGKSDAQKQQLIASSDVTVTQNNINKLKQEKLKLEKQLGYVNTKIMQEQGKLKQSKNDLNSASESVSNEKLAKENARINKITQKELIEQQKLELKSLQAKYKAMLEIKYPGIKNLVKRQSELKKFNNRANVLIKSGTDFQIIKETLKSEFSIN